MRRRDYRFNDERSVVESSAFPEVRKAEVRVWLRDLTEQQRIGLVHTTRDPLTGRIIEVEISRGQVRLNGPSPSRANFFARYRLGFRHLVFSKMPHGDSRTGRLIEQLAASHVPGCFKQGFCQPARFLFFSGHIQRRYFSLPISI
jgi:hypothetical protein